MEVFPIQDEQDARYFKLELEDVALKSEMDGGYVLSRPRHSRAPRKTFTTGFTDISDASKAILETFYDTVRGGSDVFTWTDPVNSVEYNVRFKDALKFDYAGVYGNHRWNITDIKLEQA